MAVSAYFQTIDALGRGTTATDVAGRVLPLDEAVADAIARLRRTREASGRAMFIGNGGSAGIASHAAIDYSKNGGIPSLAFNDGALLTCLGNDFGFENVFAQSLRLHARTGDMLIAISSSGKSPNILNAVSAAREIGCVVVTFSGFSVDNPLRSLGDVNFHVASNLYGFVEIVHMALCHAILDFADGAVPFDGGNRG